jgi:hypothetical protein
MVGDAYTSLPGTSFDAMSPPVSQFLDPVEPSWVLRVLRPGVSASTSYRDEDVPAEAKKGWMLLKPYSVT